MDPRIKKLIDSFTSNGWGTPVNPEISNEWWFEEIFAFESVWNPVGRTLYMTLLIDPLDEKRKEIWAVSISSALPDQENRYQIDQLSLNKINKTDLNAFVHRINKKILH